MLIQYPHQAPIMATLSFILVTNSIFLVLLLRQFLLAHATAMSWSLLAAFFRGNLFYVYCQTIFLMLGFDRTRLERNFQHFPPSSFSSWPNPVANDRFNLCVSRIQRRFAPSTPCNAQEIRFLPCRIEVIMVGPVVRIQPNHLSFSSSAAHNEIYGFKSRFGKGEFYTEILSEYGKSSIVSAMYRSLGCR